MKIKRKDRSVPGLNMTATADISFMLLIYFLVTTSMYVDKGLSRQLPPKDDNKKVEEVAVDKADVLAVRLDSAGVMTINDSVVRPSDAKSHIEDFILHRGAKHLITIETAAHCKYGPYFHLQNAISEAYVEARNKIAHDQYGRSLEQLTNHDREQVLEKCPQRVAEDYSIGEGDS